MFSYSAINMFFSQYNNNTIIFLRAKTETDVLLFSKGTTYTRSTCYLHILLYYIFVKRKAVKWHNRHFSLLLAAVAEMRCCMCENRHESWNSIKHPLVCQYLLRLHFSFFRLFWRRHAKIIIWRKRMIFFCSSILLSVFVGRIASS